MEKFFNFYLNKSHVRLIRFFFSLVRQTFVLCQTVLYLQYLPALITLARVFTSKNSDILSRSLFTTYLKNHSGERKKSISPRNEKMKKHRLIVFSRERNFEITRLIQYFPREKQRTERRPVDIVKKAKAMFASRVEG